MKTYWLLSFLTSLNCGLTAVALWSYFRARKLLAGASARSLLQLQQEVTELQSLCESTIKAQKRMTARLNMREYREREKDESPGLKSSPNGADREELRNAARARGLMR